MKALLIILTLGLAGCAYQHVIELGAGYDSHISVGSNPQSVIRYRVERQDSHWVYEYNHHSAITDGFPFNNREDDVVNQWSVIYRIILR